MTKIALRTAPMAPFKELIMNVSNLDHLNLSVSSFAASAAWYHDVFGFEVVEEGIYRGRPWGVLRSNDAMLCIYENPDRDFVSGDRLAEHSQHGMNHFALKLNNREVFLKKVEKHNIPVHYGGPVKWPHSTSWYISDPTGYEIEVVEWNKGSPQFVG